MTSLPDVQKQEDFRGISLKRAGVTGVELPITFADTQGREYRLPALATLCVELPAERKGVHMSRFISSLSEFAKKPLSSFLISPFLLKLSRELGSGRAEARLEFSHFLERSSPVSELKADMAYKCFVYACFEKGASARSVTDVFGIEVVASNLCPCSKAIAAYGAHNQRLLISAKLLLREEFCYDANWLAAMIAKIERAPSAPTYPLLKRVDEKRVTEQQYENPKFVEDVARDLVLILEEEESVSGFEFKVEALESIHKHNAFAEYSSNFPRGLL